LFFKKKKQPVEWLTNHIEGFTIWIDLKNQSKTEVKLQPLDFVSILCETAWPITKSSSLKTLAFIVIKNPAIKIFFFFFSIENLIAIIFQALFQWKNE
jgi:hypothetical protein